MYLCFYGCYLDDFFLFLMCFGSGNQWHLHFRVLMILIELTLFLWHMSDDATEGVTNDSSRLQLSINWHVLFMFSCLGTDKALCPMPYAVINIGTLSALRILTRAARFIVRSTNLYTTTAHKC